MIMMTNIETHQEAQGQPSPILTPWRITKARTQDGVMTWEATTTKFARDQQGDLVTPQFYKSAINKFETGQRPAPFFSVAHYPSHDQCDNCGYEYKSLDSGVCPSCGQERLQAGITKAIWIDGKQPKAKGIFYDNELGRSVFDACRQDVVKSLPDDERIRISMGFYPDPGGVIYPATSQRDFVDGWIEHFAGTRVPVVPETDLTVKSLNIKTRFDDAASIVPKHLADRMDSRLRRHKSGAYDDDEPITKAGAPKKPQSPAEDQLDAQLTAEASDLENLKKQEEAESVSTVRRANAKSDVDPLMLEAYDALESVQKAVVAPGGDKTKILALAANLVSAIRDYAHTLVNDTVGPAATDVTTQMEQNNPNQTMPPNQPTPPLGEVTDQTLNPNQVSSSPEQAQNSVQTPAVAGAEGTNPDQADENMQDQLGDNGVPADGSAEDQTNLPEVPLPDEYGATNADTTPTGEAGNDGQGQEAEVGGAGNNPADEGDLTDEEMAQLGIGPEDQAAADQGEQGPPAPEQQTPPETPAKPTKKKLAFGKKPAPVMQSMTALMSKARSKPVVKAVKPKVEKHHFIPTTDNDVVELNAAGERVTERAQPNAAVKSAAMHPAEAFMQGWSSKVTDILMNKGQLTRQDQINALKKSLVEFNDGALAVVNKSTPLTDVDLMTTVQQAVQSALEKSQAEHAEELASRDQQLLSLEAKMEALTRKTVQQSVDSVVKSVIGKPRVERKSFSNIRPAVTQAVVKAVNNEQVLSGDVSPIRKATASEVAAASVTAGPNLLYRY
jgi:hypothetical protein